MLLPKPSRRRKSRRGSKPNAFVCCCPRASWTKRKPKPRCGKETPVAVDLELARLETTLALWHRAAAARQAERGRELVEQATAQVRRIEHAYGPYWSHQADSLPADGDLQEACARLLSEATGAEALAAVRARWRQVEQGSPAASPRWFRARYARAQLYLRAGDRTRCAKLIELTQVLHPEMGGPAMKKQFLELLAQCR